MESVCGATPSALLYYQIDNTHIPHKQGSHSQDSAVVVACVTLCTVGVVIELSFIIVL